MAKPKRRACWPDPDVLSAQLRSPDEQVRAKALHRFTLESRIRALVFAADHQRLEAIDQLVTAGTPVNQADAEWGRLPLHVAAGSGRPASVRRLLGHGADPNLRDPRHHRTPLEECQPPDGNPDSPGHQQAAGILRAVTREQDGS